jgi:dTDP-4-amino-4,6-dideoxygalactose transaminase
MDRINSGRIFLSPPHLGTDEVEFVREAFESNYIAPLGPMVDAFEREFSEYVGVTHCLALSSGTAAMHLALRELGLGPGDEVIASTLTFIGSVSPAVFLGASLTFIDCDVATWNMSPELLAEELAACAKRGKLPKAVIPTDLYGQCCDLDGITRVCQCYEIPVVADAAEAMGSFRTGENPASSPDSWHHAGCGSHAAVFSFNGNKIMTTSGGGMLASEDRELITHARKLSQQAREPMPYYEHLEIGYNYRMSNILAGIGRGQLRVLNERVATKRHIFEQYRELLGNLPGLTFMPEWAGGRGNRWLTVVLVDAKEFGATPEQIRVALEAENIESRPVWKPMHLQPVFKGCTVRGRDVSERLFRTGLCLPSGTAMTESDVERVAEAIRRCQRLAAFA